MNKTIRARSAILREMNKAIEAFGSLKKQYPGTWFDRMSCKRLAEIGKQP